MLRNYGPTCDLVPLTPENWETMLERIDCLLVTSTWRGKDGEWIGVSQYSSPKRRKLLELMRAAKRRDCPVLFYSKEDPPNYDIFLEFAKEADYIFTSARECVPAYQAACPNARVRYLTFAVNPLLHNPIGSEGEKRKNAVFFPGSWMVKYPERTKQMDIMFRSVVKAGLKLHIADRNFSSRNFRYQFPLRYLRHVLGEFRYEQIAGMYKVYPWCINLNSVTGSDTMFAMRVYDALACGCQVLSNHSQGVRQMFPEVHIIKDEEDLKAVLSLPEDVLKENKISGIRSVLRQGTVFEKMEYMLRTAGVLAAAEKQRKVGVVLADHMTDDQKKRLTAMFESQSYPHKVLIDPQSGMLEHCDMLCLWGPNREYGAFYLEDMVNGFKFTDCDYITKRSCRQDDPEEYIYTNRVADRYATVFWASAITWERLINLPEGDITFPNGFVLDGEEYAVCSTDGEST